MSALVPGPVLALLAELSEATTEIINRHWEADEKRTDSTIPSFGFFEVQIRTGDGILARFMEEGVELYPGSAK